jgi:putative transposase
MLDEKIPRKEYSSSEIDQRLCFLTVCAKRPARNLANVLVHKTLLQAFKEADAWQVGSYTVMPDHIHLFCAPANDDYTIEAWITFWKRCFRRIGGPDLPQFQSRGFHHRLRREENYQKKSEYMRANPVREGLVKRPDDWEFQGTLNELRW